MVAQTTNREPPDGARLEVTILIDTEKWAELERKGHSDIDIQHMIEQSITFKDTAVTSAPILDIEEVSLRKYY